MDPFTTLEAASSHFGGFISQIADDQWDLATCCDWPVRELVRHVVAGDAMAIALVGGASSESAMELLVGTPLEDDPVLHFASTARAMLEAFQQPGAMERTVHHPMGDMPAAQLLGFRLGEAALHGWDLANAIGIDDTLNADVVQAVWENTEPSKDMLGSLGIFGEGPSGTVADDAPLQLRLLDLVGRRP